MTNEAKTNPINDDTLNNACSYGRLNFCTDLSSEEFESVPSLRLTDEILNYIENDPKYLPIQSEKEDETKVEFQQFLTDFTTISEEKQPYICTFSQIDVTLYGVDDSLYENKLRFRKCNLQYSCEGYVKLFLFSRCQTPVAYKILCNKPQFTKATPNMGVLQYGTEQKLTIFLKRWNNNDAKKLEYKILVGRLDDEMDVASVWNNPKAVVNKTQGLKCELVDDGDETNSGENEYYDEETFPKPKITTLKLTPRPTYTPTWVKTKKCRFRVVRKFFSRIAKALHIRNHSSKKRKGKVHWNQDVVISDLARFKKIEHHFVY